MPGPEGKSNTADSQTTCLFSKSQNIYKTSTRFINDFDKVTGYRINTQKSIVVLYTSSKQRNMKFKIDIQFTMAAKKKRNKFNN